jgi:hypothetical protein
MERERGHDGDEPDRAGGAEIIKQGKHNRPEDERAEGAFEEDGHGGKIRFAR